MKAGCNEVGVNPLGSMNVTSETTIEAPDELVTGACCRWKTFSNGGSTSREAENTALT